MPVTAAVKRVALGLAGASVLLAVAEPFSSRVHRILTTGADAVLLIVAILLYAAATAVVWWRGDW